MAQAVWSHLQASVSTSLMSLLARVQHRVLRKPAASTRSVRAQPLKDWSTWAAKEQEEPEEAENVQGKEQGKGEEEVAKKEDHADEDESDDDSASSSKKSHEDEEMPLGAEASWQEPPHKKARASTQMLKAGFDQQGNQLSTANFEKYSRQQKAAFDQLLATSKGLDDKWKTCKTNNQKRALVNSLVAKEISYAVRLDPDSIDVALKRTVKKAETDKSDKKEIKHTKGKNQNKINN